MFKTDLSLERDMQDRETERCVLRVSRAHVFDICLSCKSLERQIEREREICRTHVFERLAR